jgi:hypothetical protein
MIYLGFPVSFAAIGFAFLHQLNDLIVGHAGGL